MGRAILAISGSAADFLHRPVGSFGAPAVALCRQFFHNLFHRYRPERHYMRGPGPAWRAKYGNPQG